MKMFHHNATARMFEKIRSLEDMSQHHSWRCIYLSLAERERDNQTLHTHFIVNAIAALLDDTDSYVYVCDDGDVFILFQGAVRPIIEKLSTHFEGIRPRRFGEQPEDSRFTIFDLSRHWQIFFRLCQTKFFQVDRGQETSLPHIYHARRTRLLTELAQEST